MSLGFTVRPFEDAVRIMRAANPQGELFSGVAEHYASELACAYRPLGVWTEPPPVPLISAQRLSEDDALRLVGDPRALVSYANFGGAVGTWNAQGDGRWVSEPGQWIVVDVELVQEQVDTDDLRYDDAPGSYVDVVFALWRIEGGWAAGIWSPHDAEALAIIMGLERWPVDGWQATRVWYGE